MVRKARIDCPSCFESGADVDEEMTSYEPGAGSCKISRPSSGFTVTTASSTINATLTNGGAGDIDAQAFPLIWTQAPCPTIRTQGDVPICPAGATTFDKTLPAPGNTKLLAVIIVFSAAALLRAFGREPSSIQHKRRRPSLIYISVVLCSLLPGQVLAGPEIAQTTTEIPAWNASVQTDIPACSETR